MSLEMAWDGIDDLAPRDLYALLKLRVDVFVVEQACPYPELDGRDGEALHLRILQDGALAAALRLFAPDEGGAARIGRVVTAPAFRGQGMGRVLMAHGIAKARELHPQAPIVLGAQSHLHDFYVSFGFQSEGDEYLEDGIAHIDMRLPA